MISPGDSKISHNASNDSRNKDPFSYVLNLLLHDKTIPSAVGGHHSLVTSTGRLKLLHRPKEHVKKCWGDPDRASTPSTSSTKPVEIMSYPSDVLEESLQSEQRTQPTAELADHDGGVMIEFDASEVVANEDSQADIEIVVRRKGNIQGQLECDWQLENGNMDPKYFYAGSVSMQEMRGTVKFEEGETSAKIALPTVCDPTWNMDAFYCVSLRRQTIRTTPPINAVIGRNGTISVYQLNQDTFPANANEGSKLTVLMRCFIWHNFTELPRASVIGVVLALYQGVHYVCKTLLLRSGINCASQKPCSYLGISLGSGLEEPMILIGAISCVQFLLSYIREKRFRQLRLGGKSMRRLRANLFSKMMQLCQEAKDRYDLGDVPKIIDTAASHCINDVWLQAFRLTEACAELVGKVIIMLWIAFDLDDHRARSACIILPSIMLLLASIAIVITHRSDFTRAKKVANASENWHAFVSMCESCSSVINSYLQCDSIVTSVDTAHAAINKSSIYAADFRAWHSWLLKGGFRVILIAVIIIFGIACRDPDVAIDVGTFVIVTKTVPDIGKSLEVIASMINTLYSGGASVTKVAGVLNSDTLREARFKSGHVRVFEEQDSGPTYAVSFEEVEFTYPAAEDGYSKIPAVSPLSGRIIAGQLVCFPRNLLEENVNGQRVGIDTLFKLIAGQLLPSGGSLEVAARWRIIFLPLVPVLFDGTLMYNLAYSCLTKGTSDDALEEMIWKVCRSVGMSRELIGRADLDVGTNGERLKKSDRLCISLVRALVFEVEVLLVSSVLDVLGETRSLAVLKYLKEYIRCRGCPGREHNLPSHLRHRKTVMYSTRNMKLQEGVCDAVVAIKRAGAIEL